MVLVRDLLIHSAHLGFQKDRSGLPDRNEPTIELVVADIGAQMAWTYYFLKDEFDKVSPLINQRIVEEVTKNLITPYFARDDYWWMGFGGQQVNNWNPWINYNVLQALMLVETDTERIRRGVWKLMKSTDFFFLACTTKTAPVMKGLPIERSVRLRLEVSGSAG